MEPNDDTLIVQEPGVIASVPDLSKLEGLADGNVGDLVECLDELGNDELEQLQALETKGKARTTALGAISREQQRREIAANAPADGEAKEITPLGDAESYARMRGHEIDPRKIERPVLSLDGWVLPLPAAKPEA